MSAWPRGARVGMARSKYGARPTFVDGIRFASMAEATHYAELKLLLRAGKIVDLVLQPRYPLTVNGIEVGTYIADFGYTITEPRAAQSAVVVDVKGFDTPVSRLKRKIAEAIYGIHITIIRGGSNGISGRRGTGNRQTGS